ncbi:uncharacterized protein LOC127253068 [Andrographis paniculata]|uniref:uncharacterized protein LOC127253068 n=1 Tax=Andrographis paniculata TaxID=175694 RepID=UPI0021E97FDE|nr:uncharacterized protein LOC127253068 [Andrographis paniculata]
MEKSQHTSSGTSSYVVADVECYFGPKSVTRTSWMVDNPGRRFSCCMKSKRGTRAGCCFFLWEDPPICPRAKAIIQGLLKKLNDGDAEIMSLKQRVRNLKFLAHVELFRLSHVFG